MLHSALRGDHCTLFHAAAVQMLFCRLRRTLSCEMFQRFRGEEGNQFDWLMFPCGMTRVLQCMDKRVIHTVILSKLGLI